MNFSLENSNTNSNEVVSVQTTIQNQVFSTSSSPDYVGQDADIVVGASFNMIYALTDVLAYDKASCSIIQDTSLVWGEDGLATTYSYTIGHIKDVIIPDLEALKLLSSRDTAVILQSYIDVWEQVVEHNEKAIENAPTIQNLSFSSGTEIEKSTTTSNESTISINYENFLAFEVATSLFVGEDNEFLNLEIGGRVGFNFTASTSKSFGSASSKTVGYVLSDEDQGDNFSVDVVEDERFGTIGFRTVAGVSSCPIEDNTQARFGPNLLVENPVKFDIEEDEEAVYMLTLADLSETTSSIEDPTYLISVDAASNPDGAILKIAGHNLSSSPYEIEVPAKSSLTLPLTLEKGPISASYEKIRLLVQPECDSDDEAYDHTYVSAYFKSNCNQVSIAQPHDGQVLNSKEELNISFTDFDANDASLSKLTIQYKRDNEAYWTNLKTITKSELSGEIYDYLMDLKKLKNGVYMLRVASTCVSPNAKSYSKTVRFTIDRFIAPTVLIATYPSGGYIHPNEFIYAEFNKEIECHSSHTAVIVKDNDGNSLEADYRADGKKVRILMSGSLLEKYDGERLNVTLLNVFDKEENIIRKMVTWSFVVNFNNLKWSTNTKTIHVQQDAYYSFKDSILNTTSTNRDYKIESPFWYIPDNNRGNVKSDDLDEIEFTLNTKRDPANYIDTIFLVDEYSNNKIALIVNLTIANQTPSAFTQGGFTVDTSEQQTTMYLQFEDPDRAEQQLSEDLNDIIFVYNNKGDKVKGFGHIEHNEIADKYFAKLKVYTNSSDTATFKMWDASKGVVYSALETLYLGAQSTEIGSINYPYILTSIPEVEIEEDTTTIDSTGSMFTPNAENWLKVYPNPTEGKLHVEVLKNDKTVQLSIMDLSGKVLAVKQSKLKSNRLDVSDLAPGVYFIKAEGENYRVVQRFVKM